MTSVDWTPEMEAEAERIGSRPQYEVQVTAPDGTRWQCFAAELNWAVIEVAYAHRPLPREVPSP